MSNPNCPDADHAPPHPARQAGHRIALTQLRRGQTGVVNSSHLTASDAALLGAMGLCCNAKVRLCRAGHPCIVSVVTGGVGGGGAGCRIGLARPLAERILVTVDDAPDAR